MKKIKWGIIGPGTIARQFAHDFKFVNNGELLAVASRKLETAESFAREFNIARAYGNYQDLYDDKEIDAIYVATPHNFHFEQSAAALRAGKAVLCEKPLTVNLQEAKDLIEISNKSGTFLMEGMWTYFLPPVKKAQEWISQDKIGKILHIRADFGYPFPYDLKNRWFNPDLAGGALLDIGIYPIAIAWLFKPEDPIKMSVVARKAVTGVDTDLNIQFEYANASASLMTSMLCKLHNWAYIIGEKGYIAIHDFWRSSECYLYKGEKVAEHFIDNRESFGFNFETESFNDDLINGKKESTIMPHSLSLKLQELMEAIQRKF